MAGAGCCQPPLAAARIHDGGAGSAAARAASCSLMLRIDASICRRLRPRRQRRLRAANAFGSVWPIRRASSASGSLSAARDAPHDRERRRRRDDTDIDPPSDVVPIRKAGTALARNVSSPLCKSVAPQRRFPIQLSHFVRRLDTQNRKPGGDNRHDCPERGPIAPLVISASFWIMKRK